MQADALPLVRSDDGQLECEVLGQLLAYGEVYDLYVGAGLETDHFSRAHHRQIFEAISDLAEAGVKPQLVSVGALLRKRQQLEGIGPAYFARLVDGTVRPTAEVARSIVTRLQDLTAQRRTLSQAMQLVSDLNQSNAIDVETLQERVEALVESVEVRKRRVPWLVPSEQIAVRQRAAEADDTRRAQLGLLSITEQIGGIAPGEVCGVMARPSVGKTLVIANTVEFMASLDSMGIVLFSLEMPADQIVERLMRLNYKLTREDLRTRLVEKTLDLSEYERLYERFLLIDEPGLTVRQMNTIVRQARRGPLAGCQSVMVIVDHLGLIGGDRSMSTYDRVSAQARELKELAKRHDVAVVLAIQVSRESGGDGSKRLGLGAARDSGVVEEAMDYLVSLRRVDFSMTLSESVRERYQDVLFAEVVKNRHGECSRQESAFKLDSVSLTLRDALGLMPPKETGTKFML